MTQRFTILRAESDDHLAEIERFARTIWEEYFPGIISKHQIDYMLKKLYSFAQLKKDINKGIVFERALLGKQLCGFAAFGPRNDDDEVALHKLYIHAQFRGTGCGYSLVQRAIEYTGKVGRHRLVLRVNKGNGPAIRAYKRMGFKILGGVVSDIGGGFVMDDFAMELDVTVV